MCFQGSWIPMYVIINILSDKADIKAIIEMGDQDLILMKNKGILSQRGNLMNLINVIDEEQMQENINADDEATIALEEGLQRDNKAKCIEEEGDSDLSQDKEKTITELKKEENYVRDLAKGERTSDDWSITKEGMENCVKFPHFMLLYPTSYAFIVYYCISLFVACPSYCCFILRLLHHQSYYSFNLYVQFIF